MEAVHTALSKVPARPRPSARKTAELHVGSFPTAGPPDAYRAVSGSENQRRGTRRSRNDARLAPPSIEVPSDEALADRRGELLVDPVDESLAGWYAAERPVDHPLQPLHEGDLLRAKRGTGSRLPRLAIRSECHEPSPLLVDWPPRHVNRETVFVDYNSP